MVLRLFVATRISLRSFCIPWYTCVASLWLFESLCCLVVVSHFFAYIFNQLLSASLHGRWASLCGCFASLGVHEVPFWGHFAFLCSHFCIYSDSFSISLDNSAVGCTSLVVFVSLGGSLASGFGVLHLSEVDFVSLCGSFSGVLVDRFLWFTLGCEPEKTSSAVLVQEKEKGGEKKNCLGVILDLALSLLRGWWWNDLKDERRTKKDRDMEERREEDRRRTRQRQETEREKQRQ